MREPLLRPLVVRNSVAWYEAFYPRDGKMYLAPKQRVRIW
jgi:predicted metalloendopeptidase